MHYDDDEDAERETTKYYNIFVTKNKALQYSSKSHDRYII